jgi:hypothetical protein
MRLMLDMRDVASYRTFLKIKSLPSYRFTGREAWFPDEYAHLLGMEPEARPVLPYTPWPGLFDYQAGIARLAIEKEKFAIFAEPGCGKTFMMTEYIRHVAGLLSANQCILIVSPLMVIKQTIAEVERLYGDALPIERIPASSLQSWLRSGTSRIGITNFEALKDIVDPGRLAALSVDESGMLRSHYGKWGTTIVRLGKGLRWKLALTGTPAPNDRIEYAQHSVFLDAFPTINAFLARFFVNKGQTEDRWEMKPHALRPFYRALSHWCIFLANPGVYGWRDNTEPLPPIHVHIQDVELTAVQDAAVRDMTGMLFAINPGGITTRTRLAQIAKGKHRDEPIETHKPHFIRDLIATWPDESTIVWCKYNPEQDALAKLFPDAANIDGTTPHDRREVLIDDFKAGRRKVMISKPKILGFGLNLQIATRQIFSGLQDSYESYYQAVKRSNRYGSTRPLNVHIPVTEVERPMIETVLRKAKMVQADAEAQERIFKEFSAC